MENETVMCPMCNVAMVDGVCPNCGMKAEDMNKDASAETAPEETSPEAPAEEETM